MEVVFLLDKIKSRDCPEIQSHGIFLDGDEFDAK